MSSCPRVILVLLVAVAEVVIAAPISSWRGGTANHYGGPQDGEIDPFNPRVLLGGCSYGEIDPTQYPFYNVASFSPESKLMLNLDQFGCGACFEVRCADTPEACLSAGDGKKRDHSIVVVNAGTCGLGCGDNQVNLHVFAFDKLAPIRLGNIKIQLRQVECKPTSNLVILVKNYRAEKGGYIKLVVRNVPCTGGLSEVHLRSSGEGNKWIDLKNMFGASWEGSNLSSPPFDLRLTESSGNEVVLKEVITKAGFTGEIDTKQQFPDINTFPKSERFSFVDNVPITNISTTIDPPTPFSVADSSNPSSRPDVNPDDLEANVAFGDGK